MDYSIKQAADLANLTVHTLRFYDKEGLLPFVKRDRTGNRIFTENNLEWLALICCLKNTGMPLKQINQYIRWCLKGDETLEIRKQMLMEHRRNVLGQIAALTQNLEKIDYKISHYESCLVPSKNKRLSVAAAQ